MPLKQDIVIVGGGLVGASLAAALAPLGLRVTVIESFRPDSEVQPSYDDRATAVSAGSQRILDTVGVWGGMAGNATPIRSIHVSDRGRFGITRLDHARYGVDALGYVVENRVLGAALWASLREQASVELLCPAEVRAVSTSAEAARIVVRRQRGQGREDQEIVCRLLVAADGAASGVRAQLGIEASRSEYAQTALIANVTPGRFHNYTAYERFTDSGPLALLPMGNGRCSLVWTVDPDRAAQLSGVDDDAFLAALQAAFGYRLGRMCRVGRRAGYPLALVEARAQSAPRAVIVGNAAHGLHPVAGQGFNLALRDVAVLAEAIADAAHAAADPGAEAVLQRYVDWRRTDQRRVIAFTDGLVRLFTHPLGPVKAARNAGLLALDLLPPAKDMLARQSMGLSGRLPRLARGVRL